MTDGAPARARSSAFRPFYAAVFAFLALSFLTLVAGQRLLQDHFEAEVEQALRVSPDDGPIAYQIQNRVYVTVERSPWVAFWGVKVRAFVLGADLSSVYTVGRKALPPPFTDPLMPYREAERLLPATSNIYVELPVDSPLAAAIVGTYALLLVPLLALQTRRVAAREQRLIDEALAARAETADRASKIEQELEQVRGRLAEVEPSERAHAEGIRELERERAALKRQLAELGERESELRERAARSTELDREREALEELLEEAVEDLGTKDAEIEELQESLKRAARKAPSAGRGRASEQLAKRLRTLYKTVDVEDRAVSDLIGLRDETMKLRAEEAIKRLADDPETATVRRKVGGLPPHLSIFELGFAGKGRLYYTRGEGQRYRILAVGAKNTQKTDLEYLSRLP